MTIALTDDLKKLGAFNRPPTQAQLDSAAAARSSLLDATANAAGKFASDEIRAAAAASIAEWIGTAASDLEEGESMPDRLMALAVGIADENKDGEISDDEADVIELALNAMADLLTSKGVTEEDAIALLQDGSAEAADRVIELLREEDLSDVDSFVFDAESSEAVMDGVLDAVYKKKIVVRAGKKVRINKRVSGVVRLSAAQKVAIRKAGLKSRSAGARVKRLKSMKVRRRAGL